MNMIEVLKSHELTKYRAYDLIYAFISSLALHGKRLGGEIKIMDVRFYVKEYAEFEDIIVLNFYLIYGWRGGNFEIVIKSENNLLNISARIPPIYHKFFGEEKIKEASLEYLGKILGGKTSIFDVIPNI